MKNIILAAVAATTLFAAGAASAQSNADFTGFRTGLSAGVEDVSRVYGTNDVTYTAEVGLDLPIAERWVVGAEVEAKNVFDDNAREFGVGARLGYVVTDKALVYGRVGYARLDDARAHGLDGLALGAGAEWRISERTHLTTQYRFTNYDQGADSHGVSFGIGYRF